MKKLFSAFLLLSITTYISAKPYILTIDMLNDPEYLKFILGNELDAHYFSYSRLPSIFAHASIQDIHEHLTSELVKKENYFEAGKSLKKQPDAMIVNTCATIEQRLRKNGEAGEISGNSRSYIQSLGNNWFGNNQLAIYLTSCKFDGKRFFNNACPCDFYKNLTNEQLELLKKGTQEASK